MFNIFLIFLTSCFSASNNSNSRSATSQVSVDTVYFVANGEDHVKITNNDNVKIYIERNGNRTFISGNKFSTTEPGIYTLVVGNNSLKITAIPSKINSDVSMNLNKISAIDINNFKELNWPGLEFYYNNNPIDIKDRNELSKILKDKELQEVPMQIKARGYSLGFMRVFCHKFDISHESSGNAEVYDNKNLIVLGKDSGANFRITNSNDYVLKLLLEDKNVDEIRESNIKPGLYSLKLCVDVKGRDFPIQRYDLLSFNNLIKEIDFKSKESFGTKYGLVTLIEIDKKVRDMDLNIESEATGIFIFKYDNLIICPFIAEQKNEVKVTFRGVELANFVFDLSDELEPTSPDNWFGMQNCGNTCYLNSGLKSLVRVLPQIDINAEQYFDPALQMNWELTNSQKRFRRFFVSLVNTINLGTNGALGNIGEGRFNKNASSNLSREVFALLKSEFTKANRELGGLNINNTSQQDASEFIMSALNFLGALNYFSMKIKVEKSLEGKTLINKEENLAQIIHTLKNANDGMAIEQLPSMINGIKDEFSIPLIESIKDGSGRDVNYDDKIEKVIREKTGQFLVKKGNNYFLITNNKEKIALAKPKREEGSSSTEFVNKEIPENKDDILVRGLRVVDHPGIGDGNDIRVTEEKLNVLKENSAKYPNKKFYYSLNNNNFFIQNGEFYDVQKLSGSPFNLKTYGSNSQRQDIEFASFEVRTHLHKIDIDEKGEVLEFPENLFVTLKRFNRVGDRSEKIDTKIRVGDTYKLRKENGQEQDYELVSYSCHGGGTSSGHYYAYIKGNNGKWYEHNDSSVTEASNPPHLEASHKPYIMFYKKK